MKIAIIGAGYTGLAIAKELSDNNEVVVFEKENCVGGMVKTKEICGTKLETYYRHIFKSDEYVIDLIKELKIEDNLIWPGTKMGYLSNNKIYEFGTPISLLNFKELNFYEKMKFGFNVLHIKSIKDYKKIEKYTAEEWITKRVGKSVYKKIWEPLLISKFGENKSKVSMAWLWGKIKLRSSSIDKEGEHLGYINGSYQVLTDKFYQYLINKKVIFKLNTEINSINKNNEKYEIKYKNEGSNNLENSFDIVISTINYVDTKKLYNNYLTNEEKEKIEKVKYTSARTMIIVAKKNFSNFYWLNIGDNDIPFGGIIEHTNFIDKSNYDNNHIIYISNYMMENNKLYNLSKEELLDIYLKYLTKINPNFTKEDIKEYYVFNEKYAQPIIECNYSNYILNNKLKNENMYICTMPQIYPEDRGMNYAIKYGKELARKIKIWSDTK